MSAEAYLPGQVAADLMLRNPKTVPAAATVADVRAILDNPRVQLVLLADGDRFAGAVTALPASARDEEPALGFADSRTETMAPGAPAEEAFARAHANPFRRVVVVEPDGRLAGLLCLDKTRTKFCKTSPPHRPEGSA